MWLSLVWCFEHLLWVPVGSFRPYIFTHALLYAVFSWQCFLLFPFSSFFFLSLLFFLFLVFFSLSFNFLPPSLFSFSASLPSSFLSFFVFYFYLFFLVLFFLSSLYHKRWTKMNAWLFLLKTLLPWEITEAIANPAFTDAVFLHQWCPTWCALNTQNLCCWKLGNHALNPCSSLLTQTGHGQAGCHQQRESGFYYPWKQLMCPPERKEVCLIFYVLSLAERKCCMYINHFYWKSTSNLFCFMRAS